MCGAITTTKLTSNHQPEVITKYNQPFEAYLAEAATIVDSWEIPDEAFEQASM
jgi:hypothetical protein